MGKIIELVMYKARRHGSYVMLVDPRRTSRCCPRCGGLGFPVKSSRDLEACEIGGFFYCPRCGFVGDRDYVGALNVGRAFVMGGRLVEGGEGSRYMPPPIPRAAVPSWVPSQLFPQPRYLCLLLGAGRAGAE